MEASKYVHSVPYEAEFLKKPFAKILFDKLIEFGDNVAYIDLQDSKNYTFTDMLEKGICLAISFKKIGLQKDDVIAVLMENNIKFWIIFVACIFTGVGMHAINNNSKTYEMNHYLKNSNPKIIFCSETTLEVSKWSKEAHTSVNNIVCVDNIETDEIKLDDLLKEEVDVSNFIYETVNEETQIALILNSSGTTGLPKGVAITHFNIKSYLNFICHPDCWGFGLDDVGIAYLPNFHIYSLFISLSTLFQGMKSLVMKKFDPNLFLGYMEEYGVTQLFLVPPTAVFLANSDKIQKLNLKSIKRVFSGGAPLPKIIAEKFQKNLGVPIGQLYGLTETGLVCTSRKNQSKIGSVGILAPGCSVKIIDLETKKSLGPNEIGEIYVKAGTVMKEYLNQENETKNAFNEEGFFKTGDLGYYDEEKYFFIVDRCKEIIKYKGFQVSATELEDIISSHEEIIYCGVIGIPDERAGELPCAYVVKKENSVITKEEIINYVSERVCVQKQLHGGVRFVKQIPLSASGKILRRELRNINEYV